MRFPFSKDGKLEYVPLGIWEKEIKTRDDAKWVGRHPNSLKLQSVLIKEFSQTFDYALQRHN